jgi:hypothetical protein
VENDANLATAKVGIGWSDAGLAKYNDLYDNVVKDRVSRGAVFNNELLNVFLERRCKRNHGKAAREPECKKQRIVPRDDMGTYDTSHVNVLEPGMIGEFHPSMQIQL